MRVEFETFNKQKCWVDNGQVVAAVEDATMNIHPDVLTFLYLPNGEKLVVIGMLDEVTAKLFYEIREE